MSKRIRLGLILVLISWLFIYPANADTLSIDKTGNPRVVIIDLGGISIEELNELPFINLKDIIKEGAIGLMNTSTAGVRSIENGYLTIGSGHTNQWGNTSVSVFEAKENHGVGLSGKLYESYTNHSAPVNGAVVMDYEKAKKKVSVSLTNSWGLLGTILNSNDKSSAVLGQADYLGQLNRQMALMFMDNRGTVPMAVYHTSFDADDDALGGRTNYNKLYSSYVDVKNNTNVIGITLGDWNRFLTAVELMSNEVAKITMLQIVKKQDTFIKKVFNDLDPEQDLLILLSASPSKEMNRQHNLMIPVIIWGKGIKPNLLSSSSTRREGLITNLDILPTILSFLDISSPLPMPGRKIFSVSTHIEDNPLEYLSITNQKMRFIYNARPILIKTYIGLQILTLGLVGFMLFFMPKYLLYTKHLLLFLTVIPLSLLLIGLVPFTNLFTYALITILIALSLMFIALQLQRFMHVSDQKVLFLFPYSFIGMLTSAILSLDLFLGSNLIKISTLGYDPLAGARYYGIGNEYMGVLIGATTIGITGMLQFFKNKATLFLAFSYLLLVLLLIGLPSFGSNFGGIIAGSISFGYFLLKIFYKRLTPFHLATCLALIAIAISVIFIFDGSKDISAQSHFGRTANLLYNQGLTPLLEIAGRKLNMNLKLFRYTIWSRVFILGMTVLIIAFFKPYYLIKRLKIKYPLIAAGFFAIIIGSIAALLANDSGIVAAATMLIFVVAPLICLGGVLYQKSE